MEHTEIAEIDSFCAWSKYCPSISPEQLLHIRRSANALAAFSKDCVLCMMESMVLCMDLPMMEGGDGVLIATDRCTPGGQPTLSTSLMMTMIQHVADDFDQGDGT